MSRMSPGPSSVVAALLCVGAAACAEPCPPGYTKRGETCYRNKDGGSISEVERDDASADEGTDAGASDDTPFDAGEADPPDEPDPLESDAGASPVDAMDAATDEEPAVDAATEDATSQSDSAAADASLVTCASNPCENDGTCTDEASGFRCSCREPFIGDRCEARICPSVTLRTPDDLAKAQDCGEIRGDLDIASAGIASITAKDLRYLTKVTRDLNVSAMTNSVQTPPLQSLTLPALREVDGALSILLTSSGAVEEIRLPSLTRVGSDDGQAAGVTIGVADTKLLDLSALTTVNGFFHLARLNLLCSLYIGKLVTIAGAVDLRQLHNLDPSAIQRLIDATDLEPVISEIGCCARGGLACDGYLARTPCGC